MAGVPRLVKIRSAGNETGIVLIHGFGGKASKTWGDLPTFLAAEQALRDWDILSLGYVSNLVASLDPIQERPFLEQCPAASVSVRGGFGASGPSPRSGISSEGRIPRISTCFAKAASSPPRRSDTVEAQASTARAMIRRLDATMELQT